MAKSTPPLPPPPPLEAAVAAAATAAAPASTTAHTARVTKARPEGSSSSSSSRDNRGRRTTRQRSRVLAQAPTDALLERMQEQRRGKAKARVDNDHDHDNDNDNDNDNSNDIRACWDVVEPTQHTTPFPIMELPTEIRLEIYRACLTRPYSILLSKRELPSPPPPKDDDSAEHAGASGTSFSLSSDEDDRHATRSSVQTPSPRRAGAGIPGLATRSTRPTRPASTLPISTGSYPSPATTSTPSGGPLSRSAGSARTSRRAVVHSRSFAPLPEPDRNQSQDPLITNVLRASKEIYKEARSVLYSENHFVLDLNTAMQTLGHLHQRSRRQIKHVELEIPTYNEILERFQETVRLSLRYCSGLKKFIIHMPFTLPGADGSGTTGNTTVYANGFDILRWLPQECDIIIEGNICSEIELVVNKHLHLAKTLDKLAYARRQLISNETSSTSTT